MSEESWKSSLPEEMQASPTLKDVESVESLAKQFIDQSSYLGNAIRVPGEDASSEDLQAFRQKLIDKRTGLMEIPNLEDEDAMQAVYNSLGRPETPDDYGVPEVEGADIDENKLKAISEVAHQAGISRRQFDKLVKTVLEGDAQLVNSQKQARDDGIKALKEEWGDAYDGKLAKASKVAELTNAPSKLVEAIKANQVDAETLRWLDGVAESLGGEKSEMVKQAGSGDGTITPFEARERADEIFNKMMELPFGDPRYDQLMNKRLEYMKIASG